MELAGRSRSRVEERLRKLEANFGPPAVTQTTFEVADERYQRSLAQSRDGQFDVRCVIRDGNGAVLLREREGQWGVPQGKTEADEQPSAAVKRIVREAAGVDCTVTDAVRANIHGIRNEDDGSAPTVYRLSVVFTADIDEESDPTGEAVRWDDESETVGDFR